MKTELFKKVYIKLDSDVPKLGNYIICTKKGDLQIFPANVYSWVHYVDWYLQPIAETTPEVGKTMTGEKEQLCYKSLNALYLELPEVIASDVKKKVIDAIEEVRTNASQFRQEVSDEEIEKRYINSYRPIISMEAAIWMRNRMRGCEK